MFLFSQINESESESDYLPDFMFLMFYIPDMVYPFEVYPLLKTYKLAAINRSALRSFDNHD